SAFEHKRSIFINGNGNGRNPVAVDVENSKSVLPVRPTSLFIEIASLSRVHETTDLHPPNLLAVRPDSGGVGHRGEFVRVSHDNRIAAFPRFIQRGKPWNARERSSYLVAVRRLPTRRHPVKVARIFNTEAIEIKQVAVIEGRVLRVFRLESRRIVV